MNIERVLNERAVREPPLQVVNSVGFNRIEASIFRGMTGGGGMDPRIREDKRGGRGLRVKVRNEGWVLAFARTREGYGDYG